jgi:hypothetical protein
MITKTKAEIEKQRDLKTYQNLRESEEGGDETIGRIFAPLL